MGNLPMYQDFPQNLKSQIYGSNINAPIQTDSSGAISFNNLLDTSSTVFGNLKVSELSAQIGWLFNYNINTDLVTPVLTSLGQCIFSNSKAVIRTGTSSNSSASISTKTYSRYIAGTGLLVVLSAAFTTGVSGNVQLIGLGDSGNGFFFGFDGSNFGILRRSGGTNFWTYQVNWNTDKVDGTGSSSFTLDKTKGNIYSIEIQWTGYGIIKFNVVDPSTGNYVCVHKIIYGNTSTDTSILSASLPLLASVSNTTNTTDISLITPSAIVYAEGKVGNTATATRYNIESTKLDVTSETNIITIKNPSTVNDISNGTTIQLIFISSTTDGGSKPVTFRLYKNATITGGSYIPVDPNSIIQYNNSGTYVLATGKSILSYQLQNASFENFIIETMNLTLSPNQTYTITASSNNFSHIYVSMNWLELY